MTMNNMHMDGMYVQQPHDPQRFLSAIRQNLISQVTYAKACRQLMQWCSSLTMYQPQYETSLLACLSAAVTCAPSPGFDMDLAYQLIQSCFHFKSQASPQFNERIEGLWDELNDQIVLKRQGNQEQAQRIAQQIQIHAAQQAMPQSENSLTRVNQQHFQTGRENPEYNSIGSSETTVSIRTTVYSGVTTCTLSPPNLSQTTVSMSSNSQPSTTTSSPSTVATPVENQSTSMKASSQTGVNTNVSPFHPAQTAAIIATATATATALTTSKLNSGPPPSPSSDSTPNKPLPPTHRSQSAHTPMSQLERRMSTPLPSVNPLMAALSVPVQFPDSPHQLSQQQHMMTPVNDPLAQGLPLDMHSQPPPPYNHVAGQRVLQQMPPPYHDLTPMHPGASPMQTGYGTPNKLIPQGALNMISDYRDPYSVNYPLHQVPINKLPPAELVSPYEYSNMMSRPNSLYLPPPAPYDVISPRTFTDTKSYMTALGYDMANSGSCAPGAFLQPHQNKINTMNFYPMPVSASPTKATQPMQFPQHMIPTPNHALTPSYPMQQKVYPQSAPAGFHLPPEFPQMTKDYPEFNSKHIDQVIRLTAPIIDGVLLSPFQLQHNNNSITHKFIMKENVFPTLMNRVDLDVQLRCFQQCETHLSSSWPKDQEIHIIINNYRLLLNESEGKLQKPLLLKKYCHPGYNVLQLNVSACCCSHMFELQLVHRPSISSVKSRIVKESIVPYKKSLQKITEFMVSRQSGEDCLHTSTSTSLKCPISQKIIEIPIRGTRCRHIQCFDLGSFLHMNNERETWKCPLCGDLVVAVEPNNVEVDEFIWKIIQDTQSQRAENGEEQTDIVIDDKGVWSFLEVKQEMKPSPNKRGKQEPDTPNSLSPQDKKPPKRRRLSKKGDKNDGPYPPSLINQLPNVPTSLTPTKPDVSMLGGTMKDLPLKNLETFSPHSHGYIRAPISGPNSVDSRGDRVSNSPSMIQIKNSPGLLLPDPQLDLEPSIQLDPAFTLLGDVLQHNEPTPTEDLPYL